MNATTESAIEPTPDQPADPAARLQAAFATFDALAAAQIRHRTDVYHLPPRGQPIPEATWDEYAAARPTGLSSACDYLRRNPPRRSDCHCGAFEARAEQLEEAQDEILAAARILADGAVR